MKNSIRICAIVAVLCLLLMAVACSSSGQAGVTQQQVKVERGDITISVSGSGSIEPSREARLAFGSAGKVDRILVKEGDAVKAGDVLAKLDTGTLKVAMTQAEVTLAQAEAALTQAQTARKTAERNLKNARDTDALRLALLNAEIALEQAQTSLDTGIATADYNAARAQLDKAKAWYKYVQDNPSGLDDWELAMERAEEQLKAAQAHYDNVLSGYDTRAIALKKMQVEAAELTVAQAQKNIDDQAESIAITELQAVSANQSVTQAQQSVELAQQSLEDTRRQLDEATITAPFDGVIANVLVEEGDNIPSPSMAPTPVIYMVDPALMELVVEVDEIDIPQLELNQAAIISVDALPRVEFKGTVVAVYPMPNKVGGVVLYNVRISFEVPGGSGVKVGMSTSADILISQRSGVLLVPSRAVQKNSQGATFVKVVAGKQVEERPVGVGLDDGLKAEIVSGLSEGETVIVEVKVKTLPTSMF